MVLNRSPDARASKHDAPHTTRAPGSSGYRLRSQPTATTTAPSSTVKQTKVKERWDTAKPAKEFEASLGRETFTRVTGTYKPVDGSPAWDPTMEDRSVPFHRSTPADEVLELAEDRHDELTGAVGVTVPRPVRLDISAGSAPLRVVSTETSRPAVAMPGKPMPQGNVLNMTVENLHDSVRRLSTVSPSMAASGVVSSMNSHARNVQSNTTTNPFDEVIHVPHTTTVASVTDYGAVGRGAGERGGLERMSLSPVPSVAGAIPRGAEQARPRSTEGRQNTDMAAIRQTVAKGDHIVDVFRTEYEDLDVNQYTPALLSELCTEANAHKKALTRVEEKLLGVSTCQLSRDLFARTRVALVAFIRRAQRRICESEVGRQAAGSRPAGQPAVAPRSTGPSALSVTLKRDRVVAHEHRLIEQMTGVTEEAKVLQSRQPSSDSEIRSLLESNKDLKERSAELAREALTLYGDAVDAEMGPAAKGLYDCMQLMQSTVRDTASHLSDIKVSARIGFGGGGKDLDFPAPTFAGGSDEDVYRFLDLFDQYVDAKGLSEMAALRALRSVCLKGQLAVTCAEMERAAEIRSYLIDVYGQPRALLDNRLKEVLRLGKCPTFPAEKRRDWMIRIQNQLNYLMKMCRKFCLVDDLMYSPVLRTVHDNLPSRVHQDYLEAVGQIPSDQRTRRKLFNETLAIIAKQVAQATADVNTNHVLGLREADKGFVRKAVNVVNVVVSEDAESEESCEEIEVIEQPVAAVKKKRTRAKRKPAETAHQVAITAAYSEPKLLKCVACPAKHTHMYYCPEFQKAAIDDRIQIAKAQGACRRCLRMDSALDLSDRRAWFARHEPDCQTEWACAYEWTCGKASKPAQIHMLLCKRHVRFNKDKEADFVKSLDRTQLSQNPRFFFSNFSFDPVCGSDEDRLQVSMQPAEVIPATPEQAIYMLQTAYNEAGEELLLFYDSGCSVAAISQRAAIALRSTNIVPGPIDLNVAGGQVVKNEGGLDEFGLELFDDSGVVQMRGLVMDAVTNPFARYNLVEAFEELCEQYGQGEGVALPQVPVEIGGTAVDVMKGIKYLSYFPELVFSLPSGLSIFESKIRTQCGRRGVLGGPHSSWTHAKARIEYMSAYEFLAAELRAYHAQASVLDIGWTANRVDAAAKPWLDAAAHCGCRCHANEACYSLREQAKEFDEAERIGSELTYRCIKCRACADCKKGELLEETSLQEEAEQALIEASVWLEPEKERLVCRLPFVKDPAAALEDNKQQAERIFASQMKTFAKNKDMKEAVIKAHDKLLSKGHVVAVNDLAPEERKVFDATPGAYVLPWSCVSKADSVSTPYRVVFNASFKTRSGESLNSTLAKGANKLPLILSLLLRFSARRYALAADVSMAYNAIKLVPEHYRYQQYLWKEGLDEANTTVTMVIRTLIYGVRPSGNLTGAGFVRVAEYAEQQRPHLAKGAKVVKHDTYVDDSVAAFDSLNECMEVASAMVEVLSLGGAVIKDFAFSSIPPSDKLSSDGVHVGVLGYMWNPVSEDLFLAVRPTVLGKNKRTRKLIEEEEEIWNALRDSFTKRTLQGQLARVYDPRGLATPVTALIKLDLAEVVALKTGWDEALPERLLPKWVDNLVRIHRLRKIPFPRTVVPDEVLGGALDLVVSVDASKDVAVAAVHARAERPDGSYHCRLLVAKSKLVHTTTVPRGELRAAAMGAVLGHAVKVDLGGRVRDIIFVTDSTIVLFWMAHDTRPLHTAVRNAVIEIRRLTDLAQWFHVASDNNVADVGTRFLDVAEVGPDSEWITGRPWMSGPSLSFPLRTINQVSLDAEEARLARRELKVGELGAHAAEPTLEKLRARYEFSRYVVDPCNAEWPKAVNVLAMVLRFSRMLRLAVERRKQGTPLTPVAKHLQVVLVTAEEREEAEMYFFRKATQEVKHFNKHSDYQECTIEKDEVLYYQSRVLDGQVIEDHDGILGDVRPLHFVRPVVDRYSPVAYSIMRHVHDRLAKHMNPAVMLRESRELCFVFRGRDLAIEIAKLCNFCKKRRAETLESQMGAQHPATLRVGPAFSTVQVDMAGPWVAECEHSCRSTVKVWAVIFKDPSTAAVAAYAMAASSSAGFVQAYNRHAFRHGHPVKVYVDAGSQLLKACEQAELSWLEIAHLISAHYGVGFEYEVCPPHAHYMHGAVERSIKEIKRLLDNTFKGLKLHLLAFETALAFCCNQLNNLPICLGSRVDYLGHRDVLTPNRLIMGRNNKRSPASLTNVPSNSRLAEQLEAIEKSWWRIWQSERLVDFVPQPAKWPRSNSNVPVGAIVIFPMAKPKSPIGEVMWKYGKVAEVFPSRDNQVRKVRLTYQNYKEEVWRSVTRGAREIAVIHEEDDLEFFRVLREEAAKLEKEPYEPRMAWQGVPHEEEADEADVVGDLACACIRLA